MKKQFTAKFVFYICLALITITGIWLRLSYLETNLYFGYEQGRDAYKAMALWKLEDFVLVGPKTDIGGIFHGPLFYYLLAPLNGLTGGNPWLVSTIFVIINASVTLLAAKLIHDITQSKVIALFAALLAATSVELINYGTWLSNVPLALPFNMLALSYFLKYLKTDKSKDWYLGLVIGLIGAQFEIILLLEWAFFMIIYLIVKKTISIKQIIVSAGIGILSLSWMIIFNIRHKGIIFSAINQYTTESSFSIKEGISGITSTFQTILSRTLNLSPTMLVLLILILLYGIYKGFSQHKRREIILLFGFAFMSLPTLFFPHSVKLDQLHVNLGIGVILLISLLLHQVFSHTSHHLNNFCILLIGIMITGSNYAVYKQHKGMFFESSKGLTIAAQSSVISHIKQAHPNEPVFLKSYTRPYLHEEGWQFVADYYKLPRDTNSKHIYLTIEPWVESVWIERWTEELGPTQLIDTTEHGAIKLEYRIRLNQ